MRRPLPRRASFPAVRREPAERADARGRSDADDAEPIALVGEQLAGNGRSAAVNQERVLIVVVATAAQPRRPCLFRVEAPANSISMRSPPSPISRLLHRGDKLNGQSEQRTAASGRTLKSPAESAKIGLVRNRHGGQGWSQVLSKEFPGVLNSDQEFVSMPLTLMETKDLFEFGLFRADVRHKVVSRNGRPVPLPGKAFDVLHALLKRPGQTVPKDELIKEVWPDTFVEEGNLAQMIFVLRKALGESDGGRPLIVTVPKVGYRFVGELAEREVEEAHESAPSAQLVPGPAATKPGLNYRRLGVAIAIISGLVGWGLARYPAGERGAESRLVRYTVAPPENTSYSAGKVSPDGRSLALIAVDNAGHGQLWVRRLDAFESHPLAAAEFWPFWSPDSRFIAFAHDGKLKKIDAAGGLPQTICAASLVIGGAWNRDGTIVFSNGSTILHVPAKGGEAEPVTRLDPSRAETTHDFPVFLADGRRFLYTNHSRKREISGIYLGSLDSPNTRLRLLDDISNAEYAPGYLLFARGQVLMAQRFDAGTLRLGGEAFAVLEGIARSPANLSASFSVSGSGEVLLVTSTNQGDQVSWLDRSGKRLGAIGKPGLHLNPQLSPDERTISVDEIDAETFSSDIWLYPVVEGTSSRFTFQGSDNAIWAPGGGRLAFESWNTALYGKTAAGPENEAMLLGPMNRFDRSNPLDDDRLLCEWSKDGRFLIYSQRDEKTGYDLWLLPVSGDRKPVAFQHAGHNEWCGTLSPDGRWIAYASDQSGRSEIYVQAFSAEGSGSARKWLVSGNGGHWPKWRRDGKELLYLGANRGVVAVEVTTGAGFQHGAPRVLFASGIRTPDARFDVTSDGARFLIPSAIPEASGEPAKVIVNWTKEIKP